MSHYHYTVEEKQRALNLLETNGGDLLLTARQTGISDRTLLRWRQQYRPTTTTATTILPHQVVVPTISADDAESLTDLKHDMVDSAKLLTQSIAPAIPKASLSERVIALVRLVDRIHKFSIPLPSTPEAIELELADSEGEEPDDKDQILPANSTREAEGNTEE